VASVRKRTLPSGLTRWVADLTDAKGKRAERLFETKREATAYLDDAKTRIRAGTFVNDRDSITVAKAAGLFLDGRGRDGLEESTLRQYRQHVRHHIEPLIGPLKLSQLTGPRVHGFFDELLDLGRSPAMLRKVRTTLVGILNHAQSRGLVTLNEVAVAKLRLPKSDTATHPPTKVELQLLLAATQGQGRVMVQTAIFTGLRMGELLALSWDDIDLPGRSVTVRRAVNFRGHFKPPKSRAGRRTIPIGDGLVSQLRVWRLGCPKGVEQLVFPNGVGNVENGGNVLNRSFYPAMAKAGLVDVGGRRLFRFHDLRHAAAALFIEQFNNPKRVQQLMGHASITLTFDRYGYLFKDDGVTVAAMTAIENRLFNS
jgi:integrase